MMRCAAIEEQGQMRDLAMLPEICDEVRWIPAAEAAREPLPLMISALHLHGDEGIGSLLRERGRVGSATVLVPRFRAGDIAGILGAPAAVNIRAGDFTHLTWDDGRVFDVSGVTFVESALHSGRWAFAEGLGTVVLCFRAHAAAGAIVICTAALGGRALGVRPAAQRALLERTLETAGTGTPVPAEDAHPDETSPAADLASFLDAGGQQGAAFLMALLAAGGQRDVEALCSVAQAELGLELARRDAEAQLARCPTTDPDEIRETLKAHGWGPYVRRLASITKEVERG
jgi:hypothetical protein